MNLKIIFLVGLVLSVPGGVSHSGYAERKLIDIPRWDLQMIKEAPIWQYLLVGEGYADNLKHWPERKIALQTILDEFPDSRWADDAALILAWSKVTFEKDSTGAIAALRKVIEKYPEGQTVVGLCYISRGDSICRFDINWLRWSGSLAFLNPDRTIRISKPFDRNGSIPRYLREVLVYFAHLEKYPRLTADMAQNCIADILWRQGDLPGAIRELEAIIARHPDIAAVSAADREAAAKPDGYLIGFETEGGGPVWRPEYNAYLSLMAAYQTQERYNEAVATGLKLADICSPDGWYWQMNERIGDEFARSNYWVGAEQQYQLALKGCKQAVDYLIERQKMFDNATAEDRAGLYADRTPGFVGWEHKILKEYGWQTVIEKLEKLVQEAQAKH